MLELNEQKAKLSSVNPRAELHGDDKVTACDLHFELRMSNDVLSFFDPSLKSALYRKPDASEQAELIDEPGHLPALKFPQMAAIKWGKEFAGYALHIPYGVSGKDDINLTDCQVDEFKFDCQDGGTVIVGLRIIAHPEQGDLGRLCGMIQQDVEITLTPPEADAALV